MVHEHVYFVGLQHEVHIYHTGRTCMQLVLGCIEEVRRVVVPDEGATNAICQRTPQVLKKNFFFGVA